MLSAKRKPQRFPLIDLKGIKAAAYCPSDGQALTPHLTTFCLRTCCRRWELIFQLHTTALRILTQNERITGVVTDRGKIEAFSLLNAAADIPRGAMAGIDLPTESYKHQIFVTEPLEHMLDPLVM